VLSQEKYAMDLLEWVRDEALQASHDSLVNIRKVIC
jgi:hypothetical protein